MKEELFGYVKRAFGKPILFNSCGAVREFIPDLIEVGVDVSNATVMVVEDAERFGLAQLHQLRGRIGRGGHEGWMILIAQVKTDEAEKRLEIMTRTTDGFEIAEEDMRLRGPGELLGKSQSGLPAFRFADLSKDRRIIELARSVAKATVG